MYNGHKNWDYWNVSLWISNDEVLYNMARGYLLVCGNRRAAARAMLDTLSENGHSKTPDGARYNVSRLYAAMDGL